MSFGGGSDALTWLLLPQNFKADSPNQDRETDEERAAREERENPKPPQLGESPSNISPANLAKVQAAIDKDPTVLNRIDQTTDPTGYFAKLGQNILANSKPGGGDGGPVSDRQIVDWVNSTYEFMKNDKKAFDEWANTNPMWASRFFAEVANPGTLAQGREVMAMTGGFGDGLSSYFVNAFISDALGKTPYEDNPYGMDFRDYNELAKKYAGPGNPWSYNSKDFDDVNNPQGGDFWKIGRPGSTPSNGVVSFIKNNSFETAALIAATIPTGGVAAAVSAAGGGALGAGVVAALGAGVNSAITGADYTAKDMFTVALTAGLANGFTDVAKAGGALSYAPELEKVSEATSTFANVIDIANGAYDIYKVVDSAVTDYDKQAQEKARQALEDFYKDPVGATERPPEDEWTTPWIGNTQVNNGDTWHWEKGTTPTSNGQEVWHPVENTPAGMMEETITTASRLDNNILGGIVDRTSRIYDYINNPSSNNNPSVSTRDRVYDAATRDPNVDYATRDADIFQAPESELNARIGMPSDTPSDPIDISNVTRPDPLMGAINAPEGYDPLAGLNQPSLPPMEAPDMGTYEPYTMEDYAMDMEINPNLMDLDPEELNKQVSDYLTQGGGGLEAIDKVPTSGDVDEIVNNVLDNSENILGDSTVDPSPEQRDKVEGLVLNRLGELGVDLSKIQGSTTVGENSVNNGIGTTEGLGGVDSTTGVVGPSGAVSNSTTGPQGGTGDGNVAAATEAATSASYPAEGTVVASGTADDGGPITVGSTVAGKEVVGVTQDGKLVTKDKDGTVAIMTTAGVLVGVVAGAVASVIGSLGTGDPSSGTEGGTGGGNGTGDGTGDGDGSGDGVGEGETPIANGLMAGSKKRGTPWENTIAMRSKYASAEDLNSMFNLIAGNEL